MRFKFEAIDIFSGCGGVSCGLTLAGFKVKAAVEIENSAVKTYLDYPPLAKVNVLHGTSRGDICKLHGSDILEAGKIKKDDIYLFAGCPPCQNFHGKTPIIPTNLLRNARNYYLNFSGLLKNWNRRLS